MVDEHFIDLKNAKGVADSSAKHVFNGVDWRKLQEDEVFFVFFSIRFEEYKKSSKHVLKGVDWRKLQEDEGFFL